MTAANATRTDDSKPAGESQAATNEYKGESVRGSWKFSLELVQESLRHAPQETRDLLVWAFGWCIDPQHPLSFGEFCSRVGYAGNTVYKIYSGKYIHPNHRTPMDVPKDLVNAVRTFKRMELSRSKLGGKKFVMTKTAKRIFEACDLARESQTPVIIEGASHIGKTESFTQYCAEHNHGSSRLIHIQASCGVNGLVRTVASTLGISSTGNVPALTARIQRGVTKDMILIFDEMHLLASTVHPEVFWKCIEWIRRLYDMTQSGVVLSFTKIGFAKAEREKKSALEQFFRRGVHRYNLGDAPSKDDVAAVLQAWGLEMLPRNEEVTVTLGTGSRKVEFTENPYKMLSQLAREQGLKSIIERIRYASKFAADDDADLGWEHMIRAHLVIAKNSAEPDGGWGA